MTGLGRFFDTANLTPHGFCLSWRPELLWLQVVPDFLIGLSYYSIPLALAYFVSRRADVVFGWIFWMFAAFILACGTTHFFEIWTLWHPDYATQGLLKVATAIISVATAVILWPMLPKALALPSPAALRAVNEALAVEIEERARAAEALQREIAERRRTEDALRESQKMEGLGQLTGGVAHDFNNLLMILGGNLHLLRQKTAGAAETQIAAMERAVARGESLTRQLLTFARRQTLQPKAIDLAEEMPKLGELLRRSLRGDIEVRIDLAPDAWPIEVDPNEFELALINLASNARDAMPRGGSVTIAAENAVLDGGAPDLEDLIGDFVRVTVRDTGQGIPGHIIDHIFEPFFTTKEPGKGTGLGLSQVYGFARQSGGFATVNSVEGSGTTVALYLRRARMAPGSAGDTRAAAVTPSAARETILVVEDNPEVAEISQGLLGEFGYRTIHAETGDQALALLTDGAPVDLVFSDLVMPGGISGVDLARRIRARWPGLPVLLTTGYSTAAPEASGEGFAIIPKPYRADALRRAIEALLRAKTTGEPSTGASLA
jgi:signal transduction histidine kinase/CheY-like chemotaxis protein